jgi:nicotinate-nucleotide--dimethylbenzimidazole phosphoribosyltransferase
MSLDARVNALDEAARRAVLAGWDRKTKPRGSLGELEALTARIAAIRGIADLSPLRARIVLAAADHGYAAEGVSAYPSSVTRQMLATYADGRAAINILARRAGADVLVVDAGVSEPFEHPAVRSLRLGPGTRNAAVEPAMTREEAERGLEAGMELLGELADSDVGIVALGDMGIGNTTAASALTATLLSVRPQDACGRGTGIGDEALCRKIEVVRRALETNQPDPADPTGTLAAVGGYELAVLAGVCLGAPPRGMVVLLDGFVTAAAALVAVRLKSATADFFVAAHRSPEPGHTLILAELGLAPLLDLGLRLGEGSGAALALPLVQSALALFAEMATFEDAGVSNRLD